jgi:hypothetical protein
MCQIGDVMVRATGMAAGGLVLLTLLAEPAGAADRQFSCKGQVIHGEADPAAPQKALDLNVTLGDENKLSMKTGDGKTLDPRITSNNKLQLKFETNEFVGEYFHYTGDLFLIYPSGELARLSCSHV